MAVGDRSESRLSGPVELPTSNAIIGGASPATVPANYAWVIKQVTLCNTAGIDAVVYLAVGTAATAANRFFSALPITGFDTLVFDTGIVMNAGESLYGYADRAGINVIVNGWTKQVS